MSADSKRKSGKTAKRSQNHIDRVGKPLGAQSGAGVKVAQGYSMAGVWLRLAALLYDFLLVAAVVLVVSVLLLVLVEEKVLVVAERLAAFIRSL